LEESFPGPEPDSGPGTDPSSIRVTGSGATRQTLERNEEKPSIEKQTDRKFNDSNRKNDEAQ
jgi:hypothetical protein